MIKVYQALKICFQGGKPTFYNSGCHFLIFSIALISYGESWKAIDCFNKLWWKLKGYSVSQFSKRAYWKLELINIFYYEMEKSSLENRYVKLLNHIIFVFIWLHFDIFFSNLKSITNFSFKNMMKYCFKSKLILKNILF